MDMWVCTCTRILVGLWNANFIMSHKFTEKRQNNCETKEVDDRWCGAWMIWEAHGGQKQRRHREQSRGKAEHPLGSILLGTHWTQNPSALGEGGC